MGQGLEAEQRLQMRLGLDVGHRLEMETAGAGHRARGWEKLDTMMAPTEAPHVYGRAWIL